jgi:hypothetical protein
MGVSEGNRAHESTPDSVLASESSEVRPAKLQKHSGDATAPAAEPKKWSFKAVGNAVLAMKRFQGAHPYVRYRPRDCLLCLRAQ